MDLARIAATGTMGLMLLGSGFAAASAQTVLQPGDRAIHVCLENRTGAAADLSVMLKMTDEGWDNGAGSARMVLPGKRDCMDYRWPAARDVGIYARPDPPFEHITGGGAYLTGGSVAPATCHRALASDPVQKIELSFEVAMDGARAVCRRI